MNESLIKEIRTHLQDRFGDGPDVERDPITVDDAAKDTICHEIKRAIVGRSILDDPVPDVVVRDAS